MNNIFLFTGEESFLLREQLRAWKNSFRAKHGDLNLLTLDADGVSMGQILTDSTAMPFLAEKRLIIIENLPSAAKKTEGELTEKDEKREEELKKLAEALPEVPESSVIVFIQEKPDKRRSFYKALTKIAQLKEFSPLQGAELNGWVRARAQSKGVPIDSREAEHLISLTGPGLWRLGSEIDKLSDYKNGQPATRADIDRLVVPTAEANVFHLTDALGARDHKKAIQSLHRSMAAGETLRAVFYMIVRQFRLFLQVGAYAQEFPNTSPASVAAALNLHPFVAKNTLVQVKRFTKQELIAAYQKLLDIDLALKSSGIRVTADDQDELALAIERFMVGFCRAS